MPTNSITKIVIHPDSYGNTYSYFQGPNAHLVLTSEILKGFVRAGKPPAGHFEINGNGHPVLVFNHSDIPTFVAHLAKARNESPIPSNQPAIAGRSVATELVNISSTGEMTIKNKTEFSESFQSVLKNAKKITCESNDLILSKLTLSANCHSISGKINATDSTLGKVTTSSADITLGECFAEDIKTSQGKVALASSNVKKIESSSGNIILEHSSATDIKTSQGNITLKNNSSADSIETNSGNIELDYTGVNNKIGHITTVYGTIDAKRLNLTEGLESRMGNVTLTDSTVKAINMRMGNLSLSNTHVLEKIENASGNVKLTDCNVDHLKVGSGNVTLINSNVENLEMGSGKLLITNSDIKKQSSTAQASASTSGPYELNITRNYDYSSLNGSSHLIGLGNTTTIIDDDGITINGRKIPINKDADFSDSITDDISKITIAKTSKR